MNVVLGIDGGGTRTRASIVDRRTGSGFCRERLDQAAARGRGGGGGESARAAWRGLQAGGSARRAAASAGVASATMPGVTEWITAVFDDFGVERSEVVGDEVIALDAAFKGGPGILQIAGTGSNSIGRAPDGGRESAGGWSSRLGDEGSGYWIGLHAVRRALSAYDRDEPTRILETVGEIWGTPTIDELVNLGDSTPGPDFAALAPAISQLAEEGDAVALGVLQQAAADLVEFVLLVRAKLRRKHNLTEEVPVAWIGSVIGKARLVREAFFAGLHAAAPEMPVGETGSGGHRRRGVAGAAVGGEAARQVSS